MIGFPAQLGWIHEPIHHVSCSKSIPRAIGLREQINLAVILEQLKKQCARLVAGGDALENAVAYAASTAKERRNGKSGK